MPYYECTEYANQCVNNCQKGDSACQSSCRTAHPCGVSTTLIPVQASYTLSLCPDILKFRLCLVMNLSLYLTNRADSAFFSRPKIQPALTPRPSVPCLPHQLATAPAPRRLVPRLSTLASERPQRQAARVGRAKPRLLSSASVDPMDWQSSSSASRQHSPSSSRSHTAGRPYSPKTSTSRRLGTSTPQGVSSSTIHITRAFGRRGWVGNLLFSSVFQA